MDTTPPITAWGQYCFHISILSRSNWYMNTRQPTQTVMIVAAARNPNSFLKKIM